MTYDYQRLCPSSVFFSGADNVEKYICFGTAVPSSVKKEEEYIVFVTSAFNKINNKQKTQTESST